MSDLKNHLQNERLARINRAWAYLTLPQQLTLLLRAWLWSLPTPRQLLAAHRQRTLTRIIYLLYKGHWIR